MAKIGIFGGTFNPIHNGHLIVGRDIRRGFSLDIVCLIPAAVPPHKESRDVAKAEYRLEMTRLAVEDDLDFSVSDVELKRSGPSYTIDTIGHFESVLPDDSELFFIVGMDAFLDIETWKSYKDLFQEVPFIVMSRPGSTACADGRKWKLPCEMLSSRVSSKYRFDKEKKRVFPSRKKAGVSLRRHAGGHFRHHDKKTRRKGAGHRRPGPEKSEGIYQTKRTLCMTYEFDPSLDLYVDAALGMKAMYPTVLDVHELSSVADYFIICSGRSNRQVKAIAEHIDVELKKQDIRPLSKEGLEDGHWVLMDYGHVIIHIFYEPIRSFYDLEGLWIDAKRIETESMKKQKGAEEEVSTDFDDDPDGDYDDDYSETI